MVLDYITGQTKPTDTGKLSSDSSFEGAVKIGRTELYERIGTFAELAAICNRMNIRPTMLAVKNIRLSEGP